MVQVTKEQAAAGFEIVVLVGQMIRDQGPIPAGHLYASLMPSGIQIHHFDIIIDKLIQAKCVSRKNNVLTWTGPVGR